jgi:KEOPS complex subunit Cgi121
VTADASDGSGTNTPEDAADVPGPDQPEEGQTRPEADPLEGVRIDVAGFRLDVYDPEAVLEAVADLRSRLTPRVPDAATSPQGTLIQIADAEAVCGADHLRGATRRALAARGAGEGIADDPAMDVLLYAAGVRQITRALETMGVADGTTTIAAVAVHPSPATAFDALADALGAARDDEVLAPSREALDRLGIPEDQREALPEDRWPDLALEQGALLEVDK